MWTCILLCLGVLQTSHEINSDSERLSQLQKTIHQQQDNFSQQLSDYRNFPSEEEHLKSQISSLLKRQEQMAIKLCQELIIHTSGNQDLPSGQICCPSGHWSHEPPCSMRKLCYPKTPNDVALNFQGTREDRNLFNISENTEVNLGSILQWSQPGFCSLLMCEPFLGDPDVIRS